MSKWESVVLWVIFQFYLCAQVRARNSRLDFPPNHAVTRSRGLLIIAYRVSLRTSMSKWWFVFYGLFCNRIWVDLPRACEGRACPKQFLISWQVCTFRVTCTRIPCLDYIETILTPPILSLYPVRFPSICITTWYRFSDHDLIHLLLNC
jgi:hypothetical protein